VQLVSDAFLRDVDSLLNNNYKYLEHGLRRLTIWRFVVAVLFASVSIFFQSYNLNSIFIKALWPIYIFVIFLLILTLVYLVWFRYSNKYKLMAMVQLSGDVFVISLLINITGGITGFFPLLYFPSIIAASTLFYRPGGLLMSFGCALSFVAMAYTEFTGFLPLSGLHGQSIPMYGTELYSYISIYTMAFFLVAFLSAFVAEETRKSRQELTEKERDISNLEKFNENIIQSLSSGLITIDSSNIITLINYSAIQILEITDDNITGKAINTIRTEVSDHIIANISSDQKKSRDEIVVLFPDNRKKYLGFSISVLRDHKNNPIGHIIIFQDLNDLKRLEEKIKRQDKLVAIGKFASAMAHEIKNPLASIFGSIQVISKPETDDFMHKRLMDIVLRETERLNIFVNDFLLFSRPIKGEIEKTDISRLINENILLLSQQPEFKDTIQIIKKYPEPFTVSIVPNHLKQVLWNLLKNAVEALDKGGKIIVEAGIHKNKDPIFAAENLLIINIIDSGPGIEDKDMEHIFDLFYSTKKSGSGLGLPITNNIVEQAGGTVIAENTSAGTCFKVILPV